MPQSAHNPQSAADQPPPRPLKVLIVDGSHADAEQIARELHPAGFEPDWKRVEAEAEFLAHLAHDLDIILADHQTRDFTVFRALELRNQSGREIPLILVTGSIDQETAIDSIRQGANDYLLKDRLGRLGMAVKRALQERLLREQKQQAISGWQQSAAKYRELFNNTPVGICVATSQGRFAVANPAVLQLLGYESESELIESVDDLARHLYVNPERWTEFRREIEDQGLLSGFEAEFHRKDGTKIWVSQSGRTISSGEDAAMDYEIFIEDVTRRKQTESQLNKVSRAVEQSPVSILISDHEGKIEYANPKCEQVSGYTAEELTGQNPRILQGGETPQETYEELWNTISSGREWSGDLHNKKKNGELFWEHVAISPIRNPEGAITHYLAVKEDITEKKLLEERFLRAQRMENIGTLAGGIAHDLNNVLSPIMMSIQMLRELFDVPGAAKILDVIQSSAERGASIVKQVLAFGRGMESRQIELQPNNLVREIAGLIKQTFPKTIQINSFCDRSLRTIMGDPTQIHQVLLNLCVNARDAMPGGGRLEIATSNVTIERPDSKPAYYVAIEVTDTGTGMSPEIKAKIFDPFFTTKEIGKGTGLGLSTSFGIVQNHGGFIDVSSIPGKGTCFKICFPAIGASTLKSQPTETGSVPIGHNELILVVDDEAPVRTITQETLSAYGYRCIVASNGQEAISAFVKHKAEIAVILTDMMMPVMDGATLIRSLKLMDDKIKVIAVSGIVAEDQMEENGRDNRPEIKHFLLKPFSAKTLLKLLDEVLHE